MRLKLTGALVLKEAILSCPDGRGISSNTRCRPPLKRDPLDGRVHPAATSAPGTARLR